MNTKLSDPPSSVFTDHLPHVESPLETGEPVTSKMQTLPSRRWWQRPNTYSSRGMLFHPFKCSVIIQAVPRLPGSAAGDSQVGGPGATLTELPDWPLQGRMQCYTQLRGGHGKGVRHELWCRELHSVVRGAHSTGSNNCHTYHRSPTMSWPGGKKKWEKNFMWTRWAGKQTFSLAYLLLALQRFCNHELDKIASAIWNWDQSRCLASNCIWKENRKIF